MSLVPVGFWARLMSILFADTSIELLAKQCCGVCTGTHVMNKMYTQVHKYVSIEIHAYTRYT